MSEPATKANEGDRWVYFRRRLEAAFPYCAGQGHWPTHSAELDAWASYIAQLETKAAQQTQERAAPEPAKDFHELLSDMAGSIEGPVDLAAEHDHYLYGTPKRASATPGEQERAHPAMLATLEDAERRLLRMAKNLPTLDGEPIMWEAMAVRDALALLRARHREQPK